MAVAKFVLITQATPTPNLTTTAFRIRGVPFRCLPFYEMQRMANSHAMEHLARDEGRRTSSATDTAQRSI